MPFICVQQSHLGGTWRNFPLPFQGGRMVPGLSMKWKVIYRCFGFAVHFHSIQVPPRSAQASPSSKPDWQDIGPGPLPAPCPKPSFSSFLSHPEGSQVTVSLPLIVGEEGFVKVRAWLKYRLGSSPQGGLLCWVPLGAMTVLPSSHPRWLSFCQVQLSTFRSGLELLFFTVCI